MGGVSQVSTGKSSVDLTMTRSQNQAMFKKFNSVEEAEESEESPALGLSPLRKPVMHQLQPYKA